MERPSFAVDEVKGLALTYGNAQSEGSAYPRMLAIAGAALDIDINTPRTNEAYTDEDDNGAGETGAARWRRARRQGCGRCAPPVHGPSRVAPAAKP
eukprot:jgi/Tetstr1/458934/TSEL_004405.t1